jgi:hypothetical protein
VPRYLNVIPEDFYFAKHIRPIDFLLIKDVRLDSLYILYFLKYQSELINIGL